jgi:uncharacterized protein with HEPN domain
MRRPEVLKLLFDIREACSLIRAFVRAKTFDDYRSDAMLRSAVERQFEIIGEALRQACQAEPALTSEISNAARIIGFRNRLIHGYAAIADEVVWGVIEANLPTLDAEVDRLINTGRE